MPTSYHPLAQADSCWTGIDILTSPPSHAHEVILRAGQAVVIPTHYWHAVENLEPTVAVGINEYLKSKPRRTNW